MSQNDKQKPEIIYKINDNIMKFKYHQTLERAPKVHIGLNPFYMQMRQEVHNLHSLHIKARKAKVRELLIQDFLGEQQELGEVGLGYMNTQP